MERWARKQGDVNDTITMRVDGVDDLATVTAVDAHVRYGAGAATVLSAVVSDVAAREVTVQLGGLAGWLATATIGCWRGNLHLTFAGLGPISWPEDGWWEIEVERAV